MQEMRIVHQKGSDADDEVSAKYAARGYPVLRRGIPKENR